MGFKISNDFKDKDRFSHDFITVDYKNSVVCRICKKEFTRIDLETPINKTNITTCFVKYNQWLKEQKKEQKEEAMVKMLGKYFCIWKV